MSESDKIFLSASRSGPLSLLEVMGEILAYINEKPTHQYEVVIGSDSSGLSNRPIPIITAVTIRRIGNGGRYFYLRGTPKIFHHLRDRIYAETMSSITLAQELRGRLRDSLGEAVFWQDQIHIDVGEVGLTRYIVDEVVGMVRGFNFTAVTKPNSYVASSVADRHT